MSSKSPKKSNRQVQEDASKRRNIIIASVVAVAVVAVAVVLLASGGGDSKKSSTNASGGKVEGQKEVKELFDGIPQKGNTLGKATAPVTMIEFADLQCPFCREYALGPFPVLVNKYVRTGKVRMEFRPLTFIGPDSEKAALAGSAAGQQNLEWNFTDLFFFNQGQENSGYVTDAFIDKIFKGAGVDAAKANAFRKTAAAKAPLTAAQKDAEKYGIVSTPSFVMGPTGGPYEKVEVDIASVDGFKAALDALLAK